MRIELTAEDVARINACGRYLTVTVLRAAHADCTLGGITSRKSTLLIPHPEGPIDNLGGAEDHEIVLALLPPAFPGCPVRVKPRNIAGHSMAGGNFVYSSDSRFASLYGAPLSVHDRVE